MLRSNKGIPFRSASGSIGSNNAGTSGSSSNYINNTTGSGSGSGSGTLSASSSDPSMHPNLGLHSASAKGDIGLAKFALDNGQPHYSLLNGLLPLHAACSGGNESVVRLLLSYGADINAPRQKSNKSSAPSTGLGTEGSTPLHYAAANGHTTVVRILLESGARPNAIDKDGMTPEALALTQNHQAIVSILRNFISSYGTNDMADCTTSTKIAIDFKLSNRSPRMNSSPLRAQRSYESLSSAAAGVKATLKHHKKQALAKVSSNPNLKSNNSSTFSSNAAILPPLPTSWSNRSGIDSTKESESAHSTTPGSLTFTNGLQQQSSKDSKRRPSLPSIFEKAAPPASVYRSTLLTNPSMALSHPIEAAEDDEITSSPEKPKDSNNNLLQLPSTSPSRPAIRLPSKKSLTGLFSKAGGNSIDVNTLLDQRSNTPSADASVANSNSTTISASSQSSRNRSRSSELLGQPPFTHIVRSEGGSISNQTSPTSSVDNADGLFKPALNPALHPFRPRKSSNLTTASSPMLNQVDQEEDKLKSSTSLGQIKNDPKNISKHGRKRSQSATSVPKRPNTSTSEGEFARQIGRLYGTHYGQLSSPIHDDDTKEILHFDHNPSTSGRSKTPTRIGYQRTTINSGSSPRTNRSPLISSKSLTEEQPKLSSSPSLGLSQRTLHSQNSNSSLISSTSSSHLAICKASGANLSASTNGEGNTKLPGGRSYRSLSQSEKSMASKASSTSLRSFIGLSAQEQAQAILRIADEGPSDHSSPINLTQMLAAYGEALAQERSSNKEASVSNDGGLQKQISTISLNSLSRAQLDDSIRASTMTRSEASLSPVSNRRQTPPPPPAAAANTKMNQAIPRVSRSSSSSLLGITELPKSAHPKTDLSELAPSSVKDRDDKLGVMIDSTDSTNSGMSIYLTGDDISNYKQSPLIPIDMSRFAIPATPSNSRKAITTETTPKSKQKIQHHFTASESKSAFDKLSLDTLSLQANLPLISESDGGRRRQASELNSPDREREEYQLYHLNSNSRADQTIEDGNRSPSRAGKRKGTVKAFLSGIKSNVVK